MLFLLFQLDGQQGDDDEKLANDTVDSLTFPIKDREYMGRMKGRR
jgi:uncharacterized protein YozE (UPF0346 family)